MKKVEHQFCMSQFKPAIIGLMVLIILVIAWSIWNYEFGHAKRRHGFNLAAAQAAVKPPASNIKVKDKMRHPYWGNCNKCHITTNVPNKAVSQVFAGPPINVNDPQPHKYWGNCNLCHPVSGGFKLPQGNAQTRLAAAAGTPPPIAANATRPHADRGPCNYCHQVIGKNQPNQNNRAVNAHTQLAAAPGTPGPIAANAKATHANWGDCKNCHQILTATTKATPAAMLQITARSVGLEMQNVSTAVMQKYGLADEEGVLVLAVNPNSTGQQAGFKVGDEIVLVNNSRVDTINDFIAALSLVKPGKTATVRVLRGKRKKKLFVRIPAAGRQAAFMMQPQARMQKHAMAAPGIAWNQQRVQQAWQQPLPLRLPNNGKVVIGTMGPTLKNKVAANFEASPYFIIYDPAANRYQSVANPNYNDRTGRGIQCGHFMVDLDAVNVVAGNFSMNSFNTLKSLHMNVYSGATGSAKDVLELYRKGQIQPAAFNGNVAFAHPNRAVSPVPYGQPPVGGTIF